MRRSILRLLGHRLYDDLHDHYLNVIQKRAWKPKTISNRLSDCDHFYSEFKGWRIKSIRAHHIASILNGLVEQDLPCAAKKRLSAARDIFNEALIMGWIDANPAIHLRPVRAPVKRQRLTLEQWHITHTWMQQHQPPWVSCAWMLALVSGQRCADLAKMQFSDVGDGILYIQQQKTGNRIAIPTKLKLNIVDTTLQQAIDACVGCSNVDSDYLLRPPKPHYGIKTSAKSISHRAGEAIRGAGIKVERGTLPSLHEVRSLSCRLYTAQGIDTQTLLGHKSLQMTNLYNDGRGIDKDAYKLLEL